MIKILFICHGNICRSACALYVIRSLVREAGLEDCFVLDSAATSREELGNPVYPPMKRSMESHGIACGGHHARQMTASDYDAFDLLVAMDSENLYYMDRLYRNDPEHKFRLLMDYADWNRRRQQAADKGMPEDVIRREILLEPRTSREVADPWYTRDFEATYEDCMEGCRALLQYLCFYRLGHQFLI